MPFDNNDEMVKVFFHVPKTAGTTFSESIKRNFQEDKVFCMNWSTCVDDLIGLANAVREGASFSLVYGHSAALCTKILDIKKNNVIIFIRNPLEHVLSYYHFLGLGEKISLRQAFLQPGIEFRGRPIVQYFSNFQTNFISGVFFGLQPRDPLATAENFLDSSTIGITERYDESIKYMEGRFSIDLSYEERKKYNADRPGFDQLDEETQALIRTFNKNDLALYELALKKFKHQIGET